MNKVLNTFVLAAGLAVSTQSFAAYSEDWGSHGMIEGAARILALGAFEDIFMFSLSAPTALTSVASAHNHPSFLLLAGGMVDLFKEAGAVDEWKAGYAFSGATGDVVNAMGLLDAGDYYYKVSGVAAGALGAGYAITSAVPEAETWAMMAAGLGLLGLQLRRRTRGKTAIN